MAGIARHWGALLAAMIAAVSFAAPLRAQDAPFHVIVNSGNAVSTLARDDVAKLFLKRIATWRAGESAVPVDQPPQSDVRRAFSLHVLRKDVSAVRSYWQQKVFSGHGFPPLEQPSDDAVVAFVAGNPNAIGYVGAGTTLPATVRAIRIQD